MRAGCRAVDGDIVAGGGWGGLVFLPGGGWAVWLVLFCAAGAEDGRQKSVIVGVRAGCRAVDGDIVAGGAGEIGVAVPVSGIMTVDAEADVGKFAPVFVFRLPFYEFRNAGNGG